MCTICVALSVSDNGNNEQFSAGFNATEADVSLRRHCLPENFRDFGKRVEFSGSGTRHYRADRIRTHNLTIRRLLGMNAIIYLQINLCILLSRPKDTIVSLRNINFVN